MPTGGSAAAALAAFVIAIVIASCSDALPTGRPIITTPAASTPPPSASLAMDATGLGPCTQPWYITCNYGVRIEGPGAYDHRGNFAWDEGPRPTGHAAHGPNGPVGSTGISGDVPAALGPGVWTISFRLWYGSDAINYVPVPGGTPRYREEDPFTVACATTVDTAQVSSATLHVAFHDAACTVKTDIVGR
jgi:hypothetical protein